MRRRPGISGLQNAAAALDKYRELGENVDYMERLYEGATCDF